MPAQWTGVLVGKMHNKEISNEDLAKELGVTPAYVSMILNGKRNPPDIRQRMEDALNNIVQKKKQCNNTKQG